jgi:subtilase family serine protease
MSTHSSFRFAVGLVLCLATAVMAQGVRVGGGLRRGFARPPIFVNVSPDDATNNFGPYSPKQIRHAYGVDALNASITGAGQKIGIVDAYGDPSIQSDLNNFCNYYGISSTTLQIRYPQGQPTTGDSGWALETALDVEWAHAIAPGATIIVSVAKSASYGDLLGAVDDAVQAGATVISMSWGGQEFAGINGFDSHFNVSGVTFVASSGDSGELAAPYEVEWPASSPYVVSVGGTTLYLDAAGNRIVPDGIPASETAWSTSGGGVSAVYNAVPSFQTGWQTTGWRTVPDVSYVADPNTGVGVAYGRYLYEVGGTSVGAPQWAALVALANQSRASTLGGDPDIYSVAGNPTAPNINPANFLDITSGSNGSDPDDLASTGYDLLTGLGSPVANNLVPALAPPKSPPVLTTITVAPASASVQTSGTQQFTATGYDQYGQPLSPQPSFTWSVNGGGAISSSGLFTAGTTAGGPFTVTATTAGVSGTGSVTVTSVPSDFSLTVSPTSQSIHRGNTATYTVTVHPSNSFSGSVTLSLTGQPSGSTVNFTPNPATSTSTLTVKTSSNSPRSTFTLTIRGVSGTLSHTATAKLTVTH